MNYRRGLFRLWIILSVIWSAVIAVILFVAFSEHHRRYGFFLIDRGSRAGDYCGFGENGSSRSSPPGSGSFG